MYRWQDLNGSESFDVCSLGLEHKGRSTCKRLFDGKLIRKFGPFRVRENEYERICVFLGNTRCIYRTFWVLDPCDKTGNVILTKYYVNIWYKRISRRNQTTNIFHNYR